MVSNLRKTIAGESPGLVKDNLSHKVVLPKHLVHNRPYTVNVLIANLHEYRA